MSDLEHQKQRAAAVSVAVKLALALAKLVAAVLSSSLALASEAANNLGDVLVTSLSFFSIRIAAQPADEDHPFGHGKVEAVSALIQIGFLFALAVFILIEAMKRLLAGGGDVHPDAFAYAVLVLSIAVDLARWLSLREVARRTASAALAADALNFATDIVASILALLGLIAASFGIASGDAVAATGVALFIAVAGLRLARETVDTLVDAAPRGQTEPLRRAIEAVPGVLSLDALRLRPMGNGIIGDAVVKVPRTLSMERVAGIKERIGRAVADSNAEARILVTTEPVALDNETLTERVLLVANRRHIPVHHVVIHTVGERRAVSFDAEVDGRLSLGRSHELVSALEDAIADELGESVEIESHVEPLEVGELDGRECAEATRTAIAAALASYAPRDVLFDIHDVRVRETSGGLVVNYHCFADQALTVRAVHNHVDELDRCVRRDFGSVLRIVGHAEPAAKAGAAQRASAR